MEDNLNLLAPASPELGTAQPQLVPVFSETFTTESTRLTRLIYYCVETIYFVVFVVKSALKVIPSIIIFTM